MPPKGREPGVALHPSLVVEAGHAEQLVERLEGTGVVANACLDLRQEIESTVGTRSKSSLAAVEARVPAPAPNHNVRTVTCDDSIATRRVSSPSNRAKTPVGDSA